MFNDIISMMLPVSKLYNLDTSNKIVEGNKKLTHKENICILYEFMNNDV